MDSRYHKALQRIGEMRGKWKLVEIVGKGDRGFLYRAVCTCGSGKEVVGANKYFAPAGRSRDCGCTRAAVTAARSLTHGHTTNRNQSRTYNSWRGMLDRCTNPNHTAYQRYGGQGVTVCDRWHVFDNFLKDMGLRPKGLTLDREDPFGDYEPGNCRWVTPTEQANNTRKKAKEIDNAV